MQEGSTGRIQKPLHPAARDILFGRELSSQIDHELQFLSRIDLAHVLMLGEQKIVERERSIRLLEAISRLRAQNFEPLKQRTSYRGVFLLYESYLIETEGEAIGGMLQTGRSRNDLNSTAVRLRMREPWLALIGSALQLQRVLICRGWRFRRIIMPAYTHSQVAEPITFGHYLAGAAEAILRDIDALIAAGKEIDTSPLGAGAVAGTALPINPERTMQLLGFSRLCRNSIDAVASRDFVTRLLAAAAIYGTTLSRIASDLMSWLTSEFGFLSLPDELVGSSSAMPQKRNPYLLEHVQGRTASSIGALTEALAATRNAAFSNSIAVGTDSVRGLWRALQDVTDVGILLRLVVEGAQPHPERMLARATDSFATATAIAVKMVRERDLDFRSAHAAVGKAISAVLANGGSSFESEPQLEWISLPSVGVEDCVNAASYGGGPAPFEVGKQLQALRKMLWDRKNLIETCAEKWKQSEQSLETAVRVYCGA